MSLGVVVAFVMAGCVGENPGVRHHPTVSPSSEPLLVDLAELNCTTKHPREPDHGIVAAATVQDQTRRQVDLFVADGAHSSFRALVADPRTDDLSPEWSPDGREIVFTKLPLQQIANTGSLFLVGADGSGLTPLTPSQNKVLDFGLTWCPSGEWILFLRNDFDSTSPNPTLMAIRPDGSELVEVERAVSCPPVLSSDGSRSLDGCGGQIHLNEIGSGKRTGLLGDGKGIVRTDQGCLVQGFDPAWSPDETKVVFWKYVQCNQVKFYSELATLDLDTGREKRLLRRAFVGSPQWSPDGTSIVFVGSLGKSGSRRGMFIIDAAGSRPHRVQTDFGRIESLRW
jgi:Tol biopolymer transport system component